MINLFLQELTVYGRIKNILVNKNGYVWFELENAKFTDVKRSFTTDSLIKVDNSFLNSGSSVDNPKPESSQPEEEMGPAQAFGAPAVPMAEAIAGEEKYEVAPRPVTSPPAVPILSESTLKDYIKEGRFNWDTFDTKVIPKIPKQLDQMALRQLVNSYRSTPLEAELNTLVKQIIKAVKIEPGVEIPLIQKKKK